MLLPSSPLCHLISWGRRTFTCLPKHGFRNIYLSRRSHLISRREREGSPKPEANRWWWSGDGMRALAPGVGVSVFQLTGFSGVRDLSVPVAAYKATSWSNNRLTVPPRTRPLSSSSSPFSSRSGHSIKSNQLILLLAQRLLSSAVLLEGCKGMILHNH